MLEGMQFGAPTLASNTSSIPEVAGDAAILLAPQDAQAWAQAMLQLTLNSKKRDQQSAASLLQATRFKWQTSAAAMLELYDGALASPKRQGQG